MGSLIVLVALLIVIPAIRAFLKRDRPLDDPPVTPFPGDAEIPRPPDNPRDAVGWDRFWEADLAIGGMITAFNDAIAADEDLPRLLAARGVKTVLCIGSGLSSEPATLAAGGFDVTALDLSLVAARVAAKRWAGPADPAGGPGASAFVCGDLFDTSVCPGPYDAIIERRTIQLFQPADRELALERLVARLAPRGLLVSHCHLGCWRPGESRDHFAREPLIGRGFREDSTADRACRLIVTSG